MFGYGFMFENYDSMIMNCDFMIDFCVFGKKMAEKGRHAFVKLRLRLNFDFS